ncbi:MAG: alpha/beta hydrolase-fold protein [Chlorobiales bacterium]|nr:alpha/beta hydrolase-fold protein [Chlorobiales bacterium]
MTKRPLTRYPNVIEVVVPGITLAGNPLDDPTERRVTVYLPPSYDEKKRFPVIYLLAGFASKGQSFLNYSFGRQSVPEMAESLIADGKMQESIIVMPDCMTRYGGSQYVDSAATGNYETYLVDEVVSCIDRTLCTLAERQHRAIAGKSSGGFGALRLAMKHPDLFAAVACHSGDMGFELCYKPNFPAAARILEQYQGSILDFLTSYEQALKKPQKEFALLDLIAMAAAYSPVKVKCSPDNINLPFNPYTCEPVDEVWQEWLTFDPVEMIDKQKYSDALRSLDFLFLDCGTLDEYNLQFGHRIFSAKATRLGIVHHYEEFMDSHSNTSYRYGVSLPMLSGVIAD